ncbi:MULTISPECIES: 50S ribosomal protein L18Ae [Halomicrobium]|uniref:Large ribosomal subunit protein eL20 n=2 Tax=Halomicrobium mukohataei TaxID=57705 RepID=RL18A_HALMD|nr:MULTISPECIES: 50S ribosomal protein L18Ae [Halomicrobium]C7P2N1.1 RecName: Full=Large ribosomal subunit protein eL20; AltName: Full=50S ribosomal protein L18Ae; AltName: Full=50S ribosomal protein L20e; AltName: Full=50S ribosomal protein LX [Halomicrobium mukohataei DSM 12286]ACV47353.1 Ribosomal LX protein [Halomicrobium mukohataei DSM 12286]QCD65821.1 50S ribosomal protein L18a [Halomicrobium mukohataei]QFR20626.1 50S ribosomal protein L18a [Halomicrobium sp. ZPS1]
MSEFTVTGTFESRDGNQPFEKTVEAPNENVARDRAFAAFGSEHGLKRTQVEISEVAQ